MLRSRMLCLVCLLPMCVIPAHGQKPVVRKAEPVVMEYFYKVKWGYQDEFLRLFKKNHLPLLKKYMELGEIVKLEMVKPADHMTEDARWDFCMTITFRDIDAAFGDTSHHDAIRKQLFPDQAGFEREEQHRFELLLAHWDIPLETVDLNR